MDVWHGGNDAAWDKAQAELFAAGLTDGLPVMPPTRERVDAMLGECDAVSLHMVVTPETTRMFDAARFRKFKPGARLVNTARAQLIDQGIDLHGPLEARHGVGVLALALQDEGDKLQVLLVLHAAAVRRHRQRPPE